MSVNDEAAVSTALVERIIKGDKQAETEMVQRYHEGLMCVLYQYSNNPDLVEDIAQETWRLVVEKLRSNQLKDKERLAGFIVNIGKKQFLMQFRKNKNKEFIDEADLELPANKMNEPFKVLERRKTLDMIKGVIGKLTKPRDREILTRFYLDQDNKDVLRQEYDLSELHFNRVLFRARQRFKQLWPGELGKNNQQSNKLKKNDKE
ncbi:MAG: sigma-70 family RNA polymerase sigma factor [Psychrosphaera sp.]|nr:sigma-70 family RNA polymerase sigma factor [Psychrosphaera sp.]